LIRRDAEILRLDLRTPEELANLSLTDLEAVRLILRGGSPIDWHRLNYSTLSDVDDLLRANLLDPDHSRDMARLQYLHREALRYLRRNFAFRFPTEVEFPEDARHLFLYASETGKLNRVQVLSCVVLKTMHTINHLEARELLLETAVSEAELIQVVEDELLSRARAVIAEGLPVVHFYGSRKGRDSMVSKLLSKRASRASDILDRLRFRIITESQKDVIPVLAHLLRHVLPWNQVTAAQSTNNLVDFMRFLREERSLSGYESLLQVEIQEGENGAPVRNEFSGGSYRMINFIIDVPVRLDHMLSRAGDPWMLQKGSIVYVACEFQVVDQETAFLNEQGDNSHAKYKVRQREKVAERLMWGLLREKNKSKAPANGDTRRGARVSRKPPTISPLSEESTIKPTRQATRKARPPRPGLPFDLGQETVPPEPLPIRLRSAEEDSLLEPLRLEAEDSLFFDHSDATRETS
jgi:uncharacterized protein (TIGR04552 family)